jgi:tripartite-type tricarboxylate transporter receptor subunit TctC
MVLFDRSQCPAEFSDELVDPLAGLIGKQLAEPATRDKLTAIALEPWAGSTPASFAAFISTEVDRWAQMVKSSGAELD